MTKKDYLNSSKTRKFQAGGPMEGQPSAGGGSPEDKIKMLLQQAVESQDPNLALQVCNALYEMFAGGAAAGGQPQGAPSMPAGAPAPGQGQPAPAPQMGRYGMKTPPPMSR